MVRSHRHWLQHELLKKSAFSLEKIESLNEVKAVSQRELIDQLPQIPMPSLKSVLSAKSAEELTNCYGGSHNTNHSTTHFSSQPECGKASVGAVGAVAAVSDTRQGSGPGAVDDLKFGGIIQKS